MSDWLGWISASAAGAAGDLARLVGLAEHSSPWGVAGPVGAGALAAFAAVYLMLGDVRGPSAAPSFPPVPPWARRLARRASASGAALAAAAGKMLGRLAPKGEDAGSAGMALPEMIDIVNLGLSAGLSFDGALAEYCAQASGPLAEELRASQLAWRMGLAGRRDALMAAAQRLEEPGLSRFAATVCEALELGTPLASTLARQATLARDEQRARVEERIERAPVKMLVPMGTLVVPAMLLAIVGPLVAAMA